METCFVASATVRSQGNKSPLSRYQNTFVSSETAALLPKGNTVRIKIHNYRDRLHAFCSRHSGQRYTNYRASAGSYSSIPSNTSTPHLFRSPSSTYLKYTVFILVYVRVIIGGYQNF